MRETVLIVDDDPVQRRLVEAMVQRFGYEALTAEGGDAALTMLVGEQARPVECVILDLVMPDLSGAEVLTSLKADPATQHIPVMIVTSQVVSEETHARLLGQAAGLLFKHTLTRDGLLRAVRQAVERVGLTTDA